LETAKKYINCVLSAPGVCFPLFKKKTKQTNKQNQTKKKKKTKKKEKKNEKKKKRNNK
jgi:hypothetical protein